MDTKDEERCPDRGSTQPARPAESEPVLESSGDPLSACEQQVEELKAENAELRESAESFGALAERLNRARRSGDV